MGLLTGCDGITSAGGVRGFSMVPVGKSDSVRSIDCASVVSASELVDAMFVSLFNDGVLGGVAGFDEPPQEMASNTAPAARRVNRESIITASFAAIAFAWSLTARTLAGQPNKNGSDTKRKHAQHKQPENREGYALAWKK
jgi:hypothetical protein